jgi:hypothetical protein
VRKKKENSELEKGSRFPWKQYLERSLKYFNKISTHRGLANSSLFGGGSDSILQKAEARQVESPEGLLGSNTC